ncbi:hypothetical protein COHCIP112018_00645 [Cohnella sp. JJ-181]|nr:hypothetical protein COHCIP112018_00645 [Cohnella sp. JJ-181]
MLFTLLIAVMLLLSAIAAFSDREGNVVGSLAQTAAVFCLIYAALFSRGTAILCLLASLAWVVNQLSRSDARWR